jgi:hypothetical protein
MDAERKIHDGFAGSPHLAEPADEAAGVLF